MKKLKLTSMLILVCIISASSFAGTNACKLANQAHNDYLEEKSEFYRALNEKDFDDAEMHINNIGTYLSVRNSWASQCKRKKQLNFNIEDNTIPTIPEYQIAPDTRKQR